MVERADHSGRAPVAGGGSVTASYYDVVVLGARLGGLLSGALLAKRGFRVLVLGQGAPTPSYEVGDLVLPRKPFTFLAAHSPIARRVLGELTLHQVFRRRAATMDPAFQVSLPGHRFDVPSQDEHFEREIEREFPEVKRPIEDFHRAVLRNSAELDRFVDRDLSWPPETFLERREFARASAHLPWDKTGNGPDPLAELADSHPFRLAARAPVRFATGLDPDYVDRLAACRLYAAWLRGAATLEGGYRWLRDALVEKLGSYSGELRQRDSADRVLLKRGQVSGVRIAGSGEEVGAGFVVAGCDLAELLRLLPDRGPFEDVFEKLGEPQPRYYRYTLNVVLAAEGVPVGMARDVFHLRDPRRELEDDNLLHVEAHPVDKLGRRLLCVEALLPRRGIEEVSGYLEGTRERLLDALREFVPFLDRHLLFVDSPHDGRSLLDVQSGAELAPSEPWSRGPATMEPLHGYPVKGALGVCAMPVRLPVRRLLLCNPQVVPGLGLEGTLLSAWSAARIITRSDRKKEWMRRGLWTKVEL